MLAGTLYYIALIALVATTILSASLAMTRMAVARMAQPYIAAGYQRALTSLQESIAAEMRSGGMPNPLPTFAPLPSTCANATCTYTATETIALTDSSEPTPGPSCDPSQTNCAANVQTNAYVAESRVTALITVTLKDQAGSIVATKTGTSVLRTFDAPPYVAVAGSREGNFDEATSARTAGDDGGTAAATPNPCVSALPGTTDDTSVRVAYRNAKTSACTDGSSWGNSSYSMHGSSSGWGN
ncbi:MAG TPA: hypothetical protein VFH72_11430 [Candidatus Baltobacteraceae bacterium]|nr:hypothetical protein [Candidatus Baltobacteraceae bacterium]